MEQSISYLNRNFQDYKEALIAMSEKYYPDLSTSFEDAGVASWMIDMAASLADNESYHIDRVYQETNIDSAQERASLYAIARNNSVKIPGPKGAMAEMRLSCVLGIDGNQPNYNTAPIIKMGTKFASASQTFELLEDVDFKSQFDKNGNSNRTITPRYNTNSKITGYTVSKLAVVTAGETRVWRQVVHTNDIKPFMEIMIPVENVMNVESIVVVDGTGSTIAPPYSVFYGEGIDNCVTRFYEVNNLAEGETWTAKLDDNKKAEAYTYTYSGTPTYYITKGEWKPIEHKFITEYTDKGYLKVIFGASDGNIANLDGMASFSKWQMTRILNNKNLGILPKPNSTIYILYRVGGGKASNVAKGAINRITSLNVELRGKDEEASNVLKSITAVNTTPSVSGKDMPNEKELKYLIKYNCAAQERCVTIKDYIDRILMLPPKYGTPFRVGVSEENNKIMVYLLGLDHEGHLDSSLPVTLIKNIERYLSRYKMVNDYVEIKSGRIINLSFEADVIVDKNYDKSAIVSEIISKIKNYMDVNKQLMGEEIYMGDLEKEISKIDGVINLIELNVFNITDDDHSKIKIGQETIDNESYSEETFDYNASPDEALVDLDATDGILYNEGDTMMEIKFPERDIRVRIKER